MKKTIFLTLLAILTLALSAQNPLLQNYLHSMKVYGYIDATGNIYAPQIHTDTIIFGDVLIVIDTVNNLVEIIGGDLVIKDPKSSFLVNESDVFRDEYDPRAYGADNTGGTDATAYFNSIVEGNEYNVIHPAKGTYQIDGTVTFDANTVLVPDPKTFFRGYGELVGNNTIIPSGINWTWLDTTITISGTWIVEQWKPIWLKGGTMYGSQPNAVDSICNVLTNSGYVYNYSNIDFQGSILNKGDPIATKIWDSDDTTIFLTSKDVVIGGGVTQGEEVLRVVGDAWFDGIIDGNYIVKPSEDLVLFGEGIQLTDTTYFLGTGVGGAGSGMAALTQYTAAFINSIGRLNKCIGNVDSTMLRGCFGIFAEAGTEGNPVNIYLPGSFIYSLSFSWSAGKPIYLSPMNGSLSQNIPTVSGHWVLEIGKAYSSNIIYFNPKSPILIH